MSCDIIIPVWDQLKFTKECVESIINRTHYPYKLIIVDNGSRRETAGYLKSVADNTGARLIRNEENLGFVKAVNQGLKDSSAPYICIMNNDTIVTDGWLAEMVNVAESEKEIGLVNPSSNNIGQHKKGRETLEEYASGLTAFKGKYIEMGSCIGFCMLIKREVFKRIGYLDEVFRDGNFDDTDYSRKSEKEGYICVRAKGAYVYHHMKASFLKLKGYEESFKRNQGIYNRRWGKPRRLLYIMTKGHGKLFDWMKDDIHTKARGGNWVFLFFKGSADAPEIPEHSNMRLIHLPSLFFELNCLFRILKKKKKFDSIYTDDRGMIERLKRYEKFHKAQTALIGG